jgi:hypothetical protein
MGQQQSGEMEESAAHDKSQQPHGPKMEDGRQEMSVTGQERDSRADVAETDAVGECKEFFGGIGCMVKKVAGAVGEAIKGTVLDK